MQNNSVLTTREKKQCSLWTAHGYLKPKVFTEPDMLCQVCWDVILFTVIGNTHLEGCK